jgi:hypothetical protein
MTRMHHPLKGASPGGTVNYPYPAGGFEAEEFGKKFYRSTTGISLICLHADDCLGSIVVPALNGRTDG